MRVGACLPDALMTPVMNTPTHPPLAALVEGLIDYAGLFPPAGLSMGEVIRNFVAYRSGGHAKLLGRCVVPLARLTDFERQLAELPGSAQAGWRLSVLGTQNPSSDWAAINAFNLRHPDARIVSVEVKATSETEINALAQAFPPIVEVWVEIPSGRDSTSLVAALAHAKRGAKIRTGGTAPEAFPAAEDVARFLATCHRAGVVAKATAGLHHPFSGVHPLSYEAEAPVGAMFGFINIFLAATLTQKGTPAEVVAALLLDRDPANFHCSSQVISWREHAFAPAELSKARQTLLRSFGSCSFTEPIDGLEAVGWL